MNTLDIYILTQKSLHELKPLKEDCLVDILSHAPFLQFQRGEFGNVVNHRHNQWQWVWMMVVDAKLCLLLKTNPCPSPVCDGPPIWAGICAQCSGILSSAATQQEYDRTKMAAAFLVPSKPLQHLLFIMSMVSTAYFDWLAKRALARLVIWFGREHHFAFMARAVR